MSSPFWQKIESGSPDWRMHNGDADPGSHLHVLFTLCPLYSQGELHASSLIGKSETIKDSRVAGKVVGVQKALQEVAQASQEKGGKVQATVVFANKGVLLHEQPRAEDEQALKHHAWLYSQAFFQFCKDLGVSLTFTDYHEAGVNFPQFITTTQLPPISGTTPASYEGATPEGILNISNAYLQQLQVPTVIEQKKDTRKVAKELDHAFGSAMAVWLITSYLAFDFKIPQLLGGKGLYLSAERMISLFKIALMTPGLQSLPRLEIKA